MDYRYYRGDGIELPDCIARKMYLLRYIGALMIASSPVLALMMMFGVIRLSLFWFFAGVLMGTFGNVFFVIGMTYDTAFDRDEKMGVRNRFRLPGKKVNRNPALSGRKMIYDAEDTPQDQDLD
jgi:hypothetical protein